MRLVPLIVGMVLISALAKASEAAKRAVEIQFLTATETGAVPVAARYAGDRLVVRITGLQANSTYLIRNVLAGPSATYESTLETPSDDSGTIATDTAIPLSGTYAKADVDGLFWSMAKVEARDGLSPGYNFSIEKAGSILANAVLPIAYTKAGVTSIDLSGTGLVGKLYLPAQSTAPFPTVITFGGSEGGVFSGLMNASALANQGFAALGLAYFAAPGLPVDLKEIPLEYFEKAIRYLKSRSDIGPIAVMGPSRGGELSLLLGATFPEIKAVIAQVPSPVRWGANVTPDGQGSYPAAWTYGKISLPFALPIGDLVETTLPDGRKAYSNRPAFEAGLQDTEAVNRAMTEIEKTNGPILFLGGQDDQVWPSCVLSNMAMQRLKEKNHPFPDEMVCFPNAGHGISSLPLLPTTETAMEHPIMHILINMGGTPEGNARAQRQAWEKTLQFLRTNLRVSQGCHSAERNLSRPQ